MKRITRSISDPLLLAFTLPVNSKYICVDFLLNGVCVCVCVCVRAGGRAGGSVCVCVCVCTYGFGCVQVKGKQIIPWP